MGRQCTHQLLFSADCLDQDKALYFRHWEGTRCVCENKVSNTDGGVCPSCDSGG